MFGIPLDAHRSAAASGNAVGIQVADSAVTLLVMRTSEELEIAEQTRAVARPRRAGRR